MNLIIPPKTKLLELAVLPIFWITTYVITKSPDVLILMSLGYIWNWAASNDLPTIFENKKYKFSLIKTVHNIQRFILRPFISAPAIVQHFIKMLPAGIFWLGVLFINDSIMPWWATFLGSVLFELLDMRHLFNKNLPPEIPKEENL